MSRHLPLGATPKSISSMPRITYISEQPEDYAKALDNAHSLAELVAMLKEWESLAGDALKVAMGMNEADFTEWRDGLALERKGEFAGNAHAKKYGAIQLPEVLFKVSIIASRFGAPWGCAYIRLKETGNLEKALS